METLKTAFVVVLLLAVLYGVFIVLNKPELGEAPELAWQTLATSPPEIEYGDPVGESSSPFPPMITAPPEMKSEITPVQPDTAEPMGPVSIDELPRIGSDAAARSTDDLASDGTTIGNTVANPSSLEAETSGYPLKQADPGAELAEYPPEFDSRAALATDEDFLPPAPPDLSDRVARLENTGGDRRASIYEQPTSETQQTPGDNGPQNRLGANSFEVAWQMATDQLNSQYWNDALRTLSAFYDRPEVAGRDRQRLVDLLDPLAGKVIYSQEHLLESPYQVRPGENLLEIAERYQVPVTLLKNINGITDPRNLTPGSMLKVVRGPFRAEVTMAKDELVLFLGDYYAGRFAVSIGNNPQPQPGQYVVQGKQEGREYFAADGSRIPPLARDNPYGRWWIDLGGNVSIHASPETTPSHGGLGCISLDPHDAADVFGILSIGSKVILR